MTEAQQLTFEALSRWCKGMYLGLPLTFLLGFFVSLVVKRWWEQYNLLPWPDSLAFYLRGLVTGGEREQSRMIRRSVVRYCLLSYILCIRRVSSRLRRRFPACQQIIKSGLLRPDEAARIGLEDWWLPLKWSTDICCSAVRDDVIKNAPGYTTLLREIAAFRSSLTKARYMK